MSTSIIGRIDEMGNRIDDLEKSIGDLMQQVLFLHTLVVVPGPVNNFVSHIQAGVDPKSALDEESK